MFKLQTRQNKKIKGNHKQLKQKKQEKNKAIELVK